MFELTEYVMKYFVDIIRDDDFRHDKPNVTTDSITNKRYKYCESINHDYIKFVVTESNE